MQHDLCCDGGFATVLFLSATVSRSDGCACVRFSPLLRTSGASNSLTNYGTKEGYGDHDIKSAYCIPCLDFTWSNFKLFWC
jgi:hypothetical protein